MKLFTTVLLLWLLFFNIICSIYFVSKEVDIDSPLLVLLVSASIVLGVLWAIWLTIIPFLIFAKYVAIYFNKKRNNV